MNHRGEERKEKEKKKITFTVQKVIYWKK